MASQTFSAHESSRIADCQNVHHAQVIANDIVTPADVDVELKDIGGLQQIIERLVCSPAQADCIYPFVIELDIADWCTLKKVSSVMSC